MKFFLFCSICLLSIFNIGICADRIDTQKIIELLQQKQMKIQSQYNLAQEQCHTNTDKFGLNFTGLQTVNTALGSKSNTYCTLAKRLKRSMEHNERQLMKVSLIANEINRGKNER